MKSLDGLFWTLNAPYFLNYQIYRPYTSHMTVLVVSFDIDIALVIMLFSVSK